jgi:hypothetical protein
MGAEGDACGTREGGVAEERVAEQERRESARRKREVAVDFIRRIRGMGREELHDLILREAGEELAQFFLAYASDLMEREPGRSVENASSLLLIGYLIRGHELALADPAFEARSSWLH